MLGCYREIVFVNTANLYWLLIENQAEEKNNMAIPVEVSYRHLEPSDFIDEKVALRLKQLESLSNEINRAHVVLSSPHHHKHKGNHYEVHITLFVPGSELVVNQNTGASEAHEDFYVALRDAFDAMERQLTRWKDKRSLDVKAHSRPSIPEP